MVLIMFLFQFLPFTGSTDSQVQNAYAILMNNRWVGALTITIVMFVSDYITSALMCWSKFHWKGRFLFLRIAILHCIAELIINGGAIIPDLYNGYTLQESLSFAREFYARTIVMIALLPVASFVIKWIQNSLEGVTVFDLNIRFSPFKFKINPEESVQFSNADWHKIADKKIDPKTLANHYDRDSLEKQLQKVNKS